MNELWEWAGPSTAVGGGVGDFFFFKYILGFLSDKIHDLGFDMLVRASRYIGGVALTLLTIWVFIQGYRVVTGQMRESLMGLVANMTKAAFIVTLATSFGLVGSDIHMFLVQDMKGGIHELMTGDVGQPEEKIDESLGWMQVAMSSVDMLESVNDPGLVAEKQRATFYIGLGTGGPAITAGTMLLLYQIAMALFIGLGPIFILCLLFDYTKGLFQKWLFYGIGTMFSMAMLSAMVSIALDMVTRVSAAMWASAAAGQLLLGENVVGGMNSMAMQQGGMGLILTALIVTAPPMAALFFNGVMGNFASFTQFQQPTGQRPPGADGPGTPGNAGYRQQPMSDTAIQRGNGNKGDLGTRQQTPTYDTGGLSGQPLADSGIRHGSQMPARASFMPNSPPDQPQTRTYQPPPPAKDK